MHLAGDVSWHSIEISVEKISSGGTISEPDGKCGFISVLETT